MGYNIELSFNFFKHINVIQIIEELKSSAFDCFCETIYEDFEYELFDLNGLNNTRNHCVIYVNFSKDNFNNMLKFLNKVKLAKYFYIELIFDEVMNEIIYCSQYYKSHKMNKNSKKDYLQKVKEKKIANDFEVNERIILQKIFNICV